MTKLWMMCSLGDWVRAMHKTSGDDMAARKVAKLFVDVCTAVLLFDHVHLSLLLCKSIIHPAPHRPHQNHIHHSIHTTHRIHSTHTETELLYCPLASEWQSPQ